MNDEGIFRFFQERIIFMVLGIIAGIFIQKLIQLFKEISDGRNKR